MLASVWVALKILDPYTDTSGFEMQGVFTAESFAITACSDHWNYMIGEVPLDTVLPHERMESWPGAYYPNEHLAPERAT